MPTNETLAPRPDKQLKSGLIGVAVAIAIVASLTGLLHARAAMSEGPSAKNALTVATVSYQVKDSRQRAVSYLGLIAAGRKADLGFELPGHLATAPLRQGTPVRQGDVIATLDDAALRSKRAAIDADLAQARAELELAQLKAKRQKELRATGAVSKQVFDETRLSAKALRSRVDAVIARLESIDIELGKTRLLAPYDGVIADRYIHQGAVVSPGVPVVRLLEIANQEAHIGVSASQAGDLLVGGTYTLKLREETFTATLLSVRPDVDPRTRTTTSVFAIPEQIKALDGEPVTLELSEEVNESGGWLPIASLQEGKRGVWTVLRVEPEGDKFRTVREAVEVLGVQGDTVFVRGTLPSGSRVVANGVHRISSGTIVSVQLEG
jgi:RND family efflux transporter MFP subunit